MTAARTSELLAKELDAVGLKELAALARENRFHDFLSDLDFPELALEQALRQARDQCPDKARAAKIEAIRQRHMQGEFDADTAESDAWAQSAEGQDAFRRLIKGE